MTDATARPSCWIVTDGKAGMESQCLGLAEAIGFEAKIKRLAVRLPWRWLPPGLWHDPLRAVAPKGDALDPPWPEVLIGSGRLSVAPVLAIRRASKGRTFAIQVQDPKVEPGRFDVVVVPEHDQLRGQNVLTTKGALHRVTAARLANAGRRIVLRVSHLPRPLVAVLVGGSNRVFRMTPRWTERFASSLAAAARDCGAGLLVSPSRRTGAENQAILRRCFQGLPAEVWDGTGDNPYFGFLAVADALVVTADSVNMVSEAAATGKPVYVATPPGGSRKFQRFHESMAAAGVTRPFERSFETWSYPRLDETRRVAEEIRLRMSGMRERTAAEERRLD